jgi:hypothetical protein
MLFKTLHHLMFQLLKTTTRHSSFQHQSNSMGFHKMHKASKVDLVSNNLKSNLLLLTPISFSRISLVSSQTTVQLTNLFHPLLLLHKAILLWKTSQTKTTNQPTPTNGTTIVLRSLRINNKWTAATSQRIIIVSTSLPNSLNQTLINSQMDFNKTKDPKWWINNQ